jgi:hypothetical protein
VLEVVIAQIVLTALVIYFVNEKLKAVIDYLHSIETRVLLLQAELKSLSRKVEG